MLIFISQFSQGIDKNDFNILGSYDRNESIKGFDSESLAAQGISVEELLIERQRVASFYMKLLAKLLEDALTKFVRKGLEPYLRSYVESILSTAYFRVPKFRALFLQAVLKKSNAPIPEWSNTYWALDDEEDASMK